MTVRALHLAAMATSVAALSGTPAHAAPQEQGGDAHSAKQNKAPIGPPNPNASLDAEARAPATDVRMALSSRGVIGAWLLAGPFRATKNVALDTPPPGVDESSLAPSLGITFGPERELDLPRPKGAARWILGSNSEGPIDVKGQLEAPMSEIVGYAGGTLHVDKAGKYFLLLGVDDGVRVSVDRRIVYRRDDPRPVREDDDIIALDLAAGDHPILLKLHQRDGAWAFRARFVDTALRPPAGAYFRLPGTSGDDARALASKMSWVSVDRVFDAASDPARYRPVLTVKFPEGAPRGVPLPVSARLDAGAAGFDIAAGGVPASATGVGELVVALPPLPPWTGALTLNAMVAGRPVKSLFNARPASEAALVRAARVLAKTTPDAAFWRPGSRESMTYLASRLGHLVARGDLDAEAQADEARELDALAASLERGVDPYEKRTGPMRRALRSPMDGEPTEFGLYIPPWYRADTTRKFPLIVGLHGMNGYPMAMMRWLFGGDDPNREQYWEERHLGTIQQVDAFIVTPNGHGNTMYRELGEDDVMLVVDWAMKNFAIDPARVTITGPSMGGIGSGGIPLHRPHVFAGAMPLCGYHSYLIRGDVGGRPTRPWERFLLGERSNVFWAENGEHLPLWIVHGTKDVPEENSGVLIDRYEKLHFPVKHEHPNAGHNVWQQTYEELKGIKWLMSRRVDLHPAHVRFKTSRTRWATSAWVTIDELTGVSGWGEIDARMSKKSRITFTSIGIAGVTFTRDVSLLDTGSIAVVADGQALVFDETEPLTIYRDGNGKGSWLKGTRTIAPNERRKHGTVTGPIRDVFHEPLLFVYGSGDDEARANEEVARSFARMKWGVKVNYPVISDAEFFARSEPLANDRALFLVGRTNKVLAALEQSATFPIHVDAGAVRVGSDRFTGRELGAAFIRPNPLRPDRYVVVVGGADVAGTLRAMSLPDLLPDFVVWDENVAPGRTQILLGAGSYRAAGLFEKDWSLPTSIADPLAKTLRSDPKAPNGDYGPEHEKGQTD